ncbi:DEAH helicase isoform 6, variant [Capsaspora owczarzaki ATCC 30864]|uniref:Regulator of telomere elongation helicase 1 homolog n=2 Tax=Capsaspora owczarzaki (strain ATCC 30864) TaxID=595528 RepID=A0A0D2X1X9_CAPO3|nr:DEAH helicase isoform 6, variant [Capsaspora owczarzaki ATCC 30864]
MNSQIERVGMDTKARSTMNGCRCAALNGGRLERLSQLPGRFSAWEAMAAPRSFTIRGVDVEFPFNPYDCQLVYMEQVIQCLQEGTNALLESPTGTGKTLCLLCAALGWRQAAVAAHQLAKLDNRYGGLTLPSGDQQQPGDELVSSEAKAAAFAAVGKSLAGNFADDLSKRLGEASWSAKPGDKPSVDGDSPVPRIIYSSRTHSQLAQAIKELQCTSYKPIASIIGSREQMCIHPEVSQVHIQSVQVHNCRKLVGLHSCSFYNNLERNKMSRDISNQVLDIEGLVEFGREEKVCPYYLSRQLQNRGEIIFMPYNYLLDPTARKAANLNLANSIIIFDEAHNLESICEDSASFQLTSLDIAMAISEAQSCHDLVSDAKYIGSIEPDDLLLLKKVLLRIESAIAETPLHPQDGFTAHGTFIFDLFRSFNLTFETFSPVLELINSVIEALAEARGTRTSASISLSKFADVLKTMFTEENKVNMDGIRKYYRCHIGQEAAKPVTKASSGWGSTVHVAPSAAGRTLSFWCFSPGFAMRDLTKIGVRSIILTSGTLSPLASFGAEMQLPFPITLENPHVISKSQLWCGVVSTGPSNCNLNSSFKTRSDESYLTDLGSAIVNYARIVPDGLLVFFPSYSVMTQCINHWQNRSGTSAKNVWDMLHQHKHAVIEPREKNLFPSAINEFYAKVRDPTIRGAVFFAVCRGKVSEGLDFADMNGRAVIITGIPYPALHDPRVKIKKQYLDENKAENLKSGIAAINGIEWYNQTAARAVNQAIGRVIRHRSDYGAIILCDSRFAAPGTIAQLPLWVRPYVKTCKNFGDSLAQLAQFFKTAKADVSLHAKPAAGAPILVPEYDVEISSSSAPRGGVLSGATTTASSRSAASASTSTTALASSASSSSNTNVAARNVKSAFAFATALQSSSAGPVSDATATSRPAANAGSASFVLGQLTDRTKPRSLRDSLNYVAAPAIPAPATTVSATRRFGSVAGTSTSAAAPGLGTGSRLSLADRLMAIDPSPVIVEPSPSPNATLSNSEDSVVSVSSTTVARPKRPHSPTDDAPSLEIVESEARPPPQPQTEQRPLRPAASNPAPLSRASSILAMPSTSTSSSSSTTAPAQPTAQTFLAKVLAVLQPAERREFSALLSTYKTGGDVTQLAVGAKRIFAGASGTIEYARQKLLHELRSFVKPNQRLEFDAIVGSAPSAAQRDIVTGLPAQRMPKKRRLQSFGDGLLDVSAPPITDPVQMDVANDGQHTAAAPTDLHETGIQAQAPSGGPANPSTIVSVLSAATPSTNVAVHDDSNDEEEPVESAVDGLASTVHAATATNPTCPVCLAPPKHPFTARCGHICCHGCWMEVLKKALECPVCRQRTRVKQLTKLYF